jgi:ribulose-5-phosphate 4-epimerase/fuculose-1-phosphate aldolase
VGDIRADARIYGARQDVGAVVHVHSPACVALDQIGEPLRILPHSGAVLSDGVPLLEAAADLQLRALAEQRL